MRYVFDTGVFIDIFRYYYRASFPKLWEKLDSAVADKTIMSTREVFRELRRKDDAILAWARNNKALFPQPTEPETDFVAKIFLEYPYPQRLIKLKALLKGHPWADPFVIAKAYVENRCVVTTEIYRGNGINIPDVCKGNSIGCTSLEGFMKREEWKF